MSELAVRDHARVAVAPPSFAMPRNVADIQMLGKMMIASGFFKDVKSEAQACVKIIAGAALGYDPFTSMNAFHIIEGKVTPTAGEIGARIKRSGRYNFRIERMDDKGCCLVFFEREDGAWSAIGRSEFTEADQKAAGLAGKDVWKKYGRNMMFARALTNGARWYCPDVFGGPVYTAEELGAEVAMDADGEMRPVGMSRVADAPAVAQPAPPADDAPKPAPTGDVSPNISTEDVVFVRGLFRQLGTLLKDGFPEERQKNAILAVCNKRTSKLADLTRPEAKVLWSYLKKMIRDAGATPEDVSATVPCDVCKQPIDADGFGHAYDGTGAPCPSDATDEAEQARTMRAASDKLAARLALDEAHVGEEVPF